MRTKAATLIALFMLTYAVPVTSSGAAAPAHDVHLATGVRWSGDHAQRLEVLFTVARGEDAQSVARQLLGDLRAATVQDDPEAMADNVSTLRWRQFFDTNPGNDFVAQSYNPDGQPSDAGLSSTFLSQAQDPWNAVPTATAYLRFAGRTTRCPSSIEECGGTLDGFNDVGWVAVTALDHVVLGLATVTFELGTGWILESDVALNPGFDWSSDPAEITRCLPPPGEEPPGEEPPGEEPPGEEPPGGEPPGEEPPGERPPGEEPPRDEEPCAVDPMTVMLHENGHVLGLDHLLDPSAVMSAFHRAGEIRRELAPADVEALSTSYPTHFEPLDFEPPTAPDVGHGPPAVELTYLAQFGDAAPGGGTYAEDFEPYEINPKGDRAYAADLEVDGVPAGEGVFLRSNAGTVQIARTGQPAPGGGTFGAGVFEYMGLNNSGDSAFSFLLEPLELPIGVNVGVYRYRAADRQLTSVVVPFVTPAPTGSAFLGAKSHADIDDAGDVVFAGVIPSSAGITPDLGVGIFRSRNRSGPIEALVVPGEAAPGGAVFDHAEQPRPNQSGDIAFLGHERGQPCGNFNHAVALRCNTNLYVRSAAGKIRTIARVGDQVAGGRAITSVRLADINNRGDIAFVAGVGTGYLGLPVFGVFLYSGGSVRPVALPDDTMPGGRALLSVGIFPHNLHLNDLGELAFNGSLEFGSHEVTVDAIWLWSHGTLRTLVQTPSNIDDDTYLQNLSPPARGFLYPRSGTAIDEHGNLFFHGSVVDVDEFGSAFAYYGVLFQISGAWARNKADSG